MTTVKQIFLLNLNFATFLCSQYKQMNAHKPAKQLNRTSEKLRKIKLVDGTFEF